MRASQSFSVGEWKSSVYKVNVVPEAPWQAVISDGFPLQSTLFLILVLFQMKDGLRLSFWVEGLNCTAMPRFRPWPVPVSIVSFWTGMTRGLIVQSYAVTVARNSIRLNITISNILMASMEGGQH